MKYFTEDECKQTISHICGDHIFESVADLSNGVSITPLDNELNLQKYASDIAQFTLWWQGTYWKHLIGFSGIHNVQWNLKHI